MTPGRTGRPGVDPSMELRCKIRIQGLDRDLEDVPEHERVFERRDFLAVLPARHLGGLLVAQKKSQLLLGEPLLFPVPPQPIGDGTLALM